MALLYSLFSLSYLQQYGTPLTSNAVFAKRSVAGAIQYRFKQDNETEEELDKKRRVNIKRITALTKKTDVPTASLNPQLSQPITLSTHNSLNPQLSQSITLSTHNSFNPQAVFELPS